MPLAISSCSVGAEDLIEQKDKGKLGKMLRIATLGLRFKKKKTGQEKGERNRFGSEPHFCRVFRIVKDVYNRCR